MAYSPGGFVVLNSTTKKFTQIFFSITPAGFLRPKNTQKYHKNTKIYKNKQNIWPQNHNFYGSEKHQKVIKKFKIFWHIFFLPKVHRKYIRYVWNHSEVVEVEFSGPRGPLNQVGAGAH